MLPLLLSSPKTRVEGAQTSAMAMEPKTPKRAASSPAGSSPFGLTSSHCDLTALAGDRAGRAAGDGDDGDDDLERQLAERFADEGGRDGRGGNRRLLRWVFPLLALPAVLILAAFVVVGFHGLTGSSRLVFLILLLAMAASVALCYRRLPSARFFDGQNWRRKFRSWRGNSGRDGQGVRWLIGGEDDDWRRFEGKGVKKYDNGDCYEGEFQSGKCHGRGVRRYSQGGRYEGDWVEGLVDGFGVEIFPVGSRYHGQYKEGARSGYGKMIMSSGEWYAGAWLAGRPNGCGVHRSPTRSSYYGEFKNGEKHGFGRSKFWRGDRYAGEYFGNKFHGFGVYHFANGDCYEGSWHEGRIQGMGLLTFQNGEVNCGEWDSKILKNPYPESSNHVLKVVKAARDAAEKAKSLPPTDDQVKNAITNAKLSAAVATVVAENAVKHQRMCSIFWRAFG